MSLKLVLLIAAIPMLVALLVYRYSNWHNYVKHRKYRGNKLKKIAEKISERKKTRN